MLRVTSGPTLCLLHWEAPGMDATTFDALVTRLEGLAARRPKVYVALAVGMAALGLVFLALALGFGLFGVAAVGAIGFLIVFKMHIAGVAITLVKLLMLLLVPAYTMVRTSITLLFARFPTPQGRPVTPDEAPELFTTLARLRRDMKGPAVHEVLLDDQLNACIVQHPRFGLFGWDKNFLILGLPLLELLSADEALAVVAHEYGHLSGHHGRLAGFIYRFRSTWKNLQELSEQWSDWGSRLVARLFRWYAPYFNAYTFVLARQNEYLADRTAVEVAGRDNVGAALIRIQVATLFGRAEFWPEIDRRATIEPEPVADRSALWQESVRSAFHEPRYQAFLKQARERKTDHLDTHPALTDRLAAMGVGADEQSVERLQPPARTAAAVWLGPTLATVRAEIDRDWRDQVEKKWRDLYAYMSERRQRLSELDALRTLTNAERWERVQLSREVRPEVDVLPDIETILEADPNHLPARFRRGALALERGDAAGIVDLEAVMETNHDAILPGCEAAWKFYTGRDADLAERYAQRWRDHTAWSERISTKKLELSFDTILSPADLDSETVAKIAALLDEHATGVGRVYLARRTLDAEHGVHDYVLAFETKRFTRAAKVAEMLQHIANLPYPIPLMVIHLEPRGRSRIRKWMEKLRIEPLRLA